ncbi:MAG: hypothetical protein HY822_16700 [Acidobacteria bacterium]|nr:hypothetical protein [Acidobacteriota bacterium]
MSQPDRSKPWRPVQAQLLDLPPATEVPMKEKIQIAQLIANGKCEVAVDIAKQVHKRCANPASEALLVDAYAARISALEKRDLHREAKALLDSVRQRFPASAGRLREAAAAADAREGNLDALLQLLDDPSLAGDRRAAMAKSIRREIADLSAVARCGALAPEHPLRVAASALAGALEAVTSGPVEDAALALPDVSRQNPLAPWKMLVRAIAAYYRGDAASCEKNVAAIDPEAVPARLAPALRALLGQKQELTPAALSLVSQTGGGIEALRAALRVLDPALEKRQESQVVEATRKAITVCQRDCPELLERLKQHISVRGWMEGFHADRMAAAMNGPSLKNAYFWRLLARGAEEQKHKPESLPYACRFWEEFDRHARHEGWFSAQSPEAATLYLHIADLTGRLSEEERDEFGTSAGRALADLSRFYVGQPAAIRALMPDANRRNMDFLFPQTWLERAAKADPCKENFLRWLDLVKRKWPKTADQVAEAWRTALPGDPQPLLHLMESAEKANAFQKAFKLMERAERLDGLNPEVRKARVRLQVSIALRHLQQRALPLLDRDLASMEALPSMQHGDRPAFTAALRWAGHAARGAKEEAEAARADVTRLLNGELAASVVLAGVAGAAKLFIAAPEARGIAKGVRVAASVARACALGEEMGIPFAIPPKISGRLLKELSAKDAASDPSELLPLGEAALRAGNDPLAYAVASAGLERGGPTLARFLFLRARALPEWEFERRQECLGAAAELARRQRDLDLLDRIGESNEPDEFDFSETIAVAMSTEQVEKVVQREKGRRGYPKSSSSERSRFGDCDCPACRAMREEAPEEIPEYADMFGPGILAQALAEILKGGLKPKPGGSRRRGRGPLDDVPF